MPRVSVILTSCNHEHHVQESIQSVLAQTWPDFELLILDDASTDRTWALIQAIDDPRICCMQNAQRMGQIYSIQSGLTIHAQGDYIAILSAQDVWETEKLAKQVAVLDASPNVAAVFTHASAITQDGGTSDAASLQAGLFNQPNRTRQQWLQHFFYNGNPLSLSSSLIRKSACLQAGAWESWLSELADMSLWIRLCMQHELHVLPESLVRVRILDDATNSVQTTTTNRRNNEHYQLLHHYRSITDIDQLIGVFPDAIRYRRRHENDTRFALAMMALAGHSQTIHKQFGVHQLYQLMAEPLAAERLLRLYQFDAEAMRRISGEHHLFATQTTAVPAQTIIQSTQPWVDDGRWSPQEQAWASEAMHATPALDCTLWVIKRNNHDADDSSLTSLKNQWVNVEYKTVTLSESPIQALNQAVERTNSTWIAFIDAGDQLAADASFRVALAIQQHPEWQVIYTDEDTYDLNGEHKTPHFKPDFNLDYLHSMPYVGGLLLIKKTLFDELGGFSDAAAGVEEYDFLLRTWEKVGDAGIGHVAEVLYHRRQGAPGRMPINMDQTMQGNASALSRHFERQAIKAEILKGPFAPTMRVRYELTSTPLVSIIIPTRNQLPMLRRCLESIIEKTRYTQYEILVVDNDSDDAETCQYLSLIEDNKAAFGDRIHIVRHPGVFNFSAMNNRAVELARGELILLLNNDTASLHDEWLDELVSHALRPNVGIVGAKLLFPDGKVQHAGVILGLRGPAEHVFLQVAANFPGYLGRAQLTQNLSAVTGACLMIRKSLYQQVGGLDETDFKVSYNDIDLCLKVRASGHRIVFTPWALLLHEGSASQKSGVEVSANEAKQARFRDEKRAFYQKWRSKIAFDPAYNRHMSLAGAGYDLETLPMLSWDPDWKPRPRILAYPYDHFGCGEYRILAPMRALQTAGRVQGGQTMRALLPAEIERMAPDSIILQKPVEDPHFQWLEEQDAVRSIFRVFELDDLLTNLPIKSAHRGHIHKDIAKRMRNGFQFCHRLVVSTEPLAHEYKGLMDDIVVQPNYIERAKWGHLRSRKNRGRLPRVGWAGGIGHTGDLEMVADVVRDLADEVEWVFFGMCPPALMPHIHEFHPGVALQDYPAKLASLDLDLAIAPLEDNAFNESKSNLRLLEYGVLGYPVVCSNVTAYQNNIPAWRVSNKYRDWIRTIRELISDRQSLALAGETIREHIHAHWMLEDHLDEWLKAWLP